MTTLDDIPDLFGITPTTGLSTPRKCGRHTWASDTMARFDASGNPIPGPIRCIRCGREQDPTLVRRGRTNRSRGNAIERDIAKALGLKRVGQFGGPDDVSGEMFVAQVKSGGAFPERLWGWLKALPRNASQTPLLVVTDAPGPGHRRRALVILELSDWAALHAGEVEP